jgi:hypothetical protein
MTVPDPAPDQLEALKRDRRVGLLAEELYAYEAQIPAHCITSVIPEEYYRAAADLLDRLETIRLQELRPVAPAPDPNYRVDAPDGRIHWSDTTGWLMVEEDGSVWELDLSGYRLPFLPTDAVELRKVSTARSTRERLVGPQSRRIARLSIALRTLVEAVDDDCYDDMTPLWDVARELLADSTIVVERDGLGPEGVERAITAWLDFGDALDAIPPGPGLKVEFDDEEDDTPPSRRDLPPRPAGEHGRTGERGEAVTEVHMMRAAVEVRRVADAEKIGPIERDRLREVAQWLAGGWPDPNQDRLRWEQRARIVPAARPAPTELDDATIDEAAIAGRLAQAASPETHTSWALLHEHHRDAHRRYVRAVATVLAAPTTALEHNVRVFLSEWDATPEDELDAPAPVIGMVEAMRQNVAAPSAPAGEKS